MSAALLRGVAAAAACGAAAALRLPNAVSSNMVLQRAPTAARLWGWGTPGETVTIALAPGGGSWSTTAGAASAPEGAGYFTVDLKPQAAGAGYTVSLNGSQSGGAVLTNVAFGDVYLCSGQSNMQFTTGMAFNASDEEADATNYPNLRLYTQCLVATDAPQYDGATPSLYQWAAASKDSVGGPDWQYFSATCYFFGRELYKGLGGKVPIGLAASDWGGQPVEVFSSPDALADASCGGVAEGPGFDPTTPGGEPLVLPARTNVTSPPEPDRLGSAAGGSCPSQGSPGNSKLWYGQIYPLLPMRLTGAVWYQGEANAGNPTSYACRFPAMIADWRVKWGLPQMSFFFVELAAYSQDYSLIRAAQMKALKLDKVGYATAIDLGDPTSPAGSIHPRRKQEVGRRLALSALKVQYGQAVTAYGPSVTKVDQKADSGVIGGVSVVLTFQDAGGLHATGTAACSACCGQSPIELLVGSTWTRAVMQVDAAKGQVTATAAGAGEVLGIRYDWEGYPQCALYNGAGGPDDHAGIAAAPFTWSAPPKSYRLVFRQTYDLAHLWTKGAWSVNPQTPGAAQFSVLDKLESYRDAEGGFELLQRWPVVGETNIWKQTSNPMTTAAGSAAQGYEPINITQTTNNWAGLERSDTSCALLDGSDNDAGIWFYAVGDTGCNWGNDGIPGPNRAAKVTELYAMDPKSSQWTLVFRQTWPLKWDLSDVAKNKGDEGAAMYSRLDELESFRGADGKLTFKMLWPDNGNIWRQTSNPVTATQSGVTGYQPVAVQHTDQAWGGLEKNMGPDSLLDGSQGGPNWYYAVGSVSDWGGKIPDWGPGSQMCELYVRTQ